MRGVNIMKHSLKKFLEDILFFYDDFFKHQNTRMW